MLRESSERTGRRASDPKAALSGSLIKAPRLCRGILTLGEPPVLDGDPFIGSRDWDISNLAIEVKDTGAFKAVGTVTFMNSGRPEQVVLELLRSGNDWHIADVAWDSGTLRALYRRHATRDSEPAPR
jgi:hypothetical protein